MKNRKMLVSGLVIIAMAIACFTFIRPAHALEDRVPYANEMRSLAGINFGVATLTSGTNQVSDPYVTTNDCIQLTTYLNGITTGTSGSTNVPMVTNIVTGSSFTITANNANATNKVFWLILRNPPH